jgi:nitrate reductase (NAD(P)H)
MFFKFLQGNMGLRFQHPAPVQPGALGNIGWREEENLARQGLEAAAAAAPAAAVAAVKPAAAAANGAVAMYTMEEVEQHASEESCWFVHEGKVRTLLCFSVRFACIEGL